MLFLEKVELHERIQDGKSEFCKHVRLASKFGQIRPLVLRGVALKEPAISCINNSVLNEKLTDPQRVAVQKLIRAKSDREIARLLRQSHRLLNLHRRRQSSISHRERWTEYEIRLLGRIRDEELAKLIRRGVTAVAGKRESLGIQVFAPQRIRWSKREIELLGKRPDAVVARMLGRTRYAVQLKRHSLGIAQCWEHAKPWTQDEESLLGTMRDQPLAKKLKRTLSCVRTRRNEKTKVRFARTPKRWTAFQLRLLGRMPDTKVARRTGRFLASVRNKRVKLGIARSASKH